MVSQKQEILKVNKTEGSIDIKLPNGKAITHYLTDTARKYIRNIQPGEASISYADEFDDMGIPLVSFAKNTSIKKELPVFQKEAREEKAITMLVAYSKDLAVAMIEHAKAANIAINTEKIMADSNLQILKSYNFFKEAMDKDANNINSS